MRNAEIQNRGDLMRTLVWLPVITASCALGSCSGGGGPTSPNYTTSLVVLVVTPTGPIEATWSQTFWCFYYHTDGTKWVEIVAPPPNGQIGEKRMVFEWPGGTISVGATVNATAIYSEGGTAVVDSVSLSVPVAYGNATIIFTWSGGTKIAPGGAYDGYIVPYNAQGAGCAPS